MSAALLSRAANASSQSKFKIPNKYIKGSIHPNYTNNILLKMFTFFVQFEFSQKKTFLPAPLHTHR